MKILGAITSRCAGKEPAFLTLQLRRNGDRLRATQIKPLWKYVAVK